MAYEERGHEEGAEDGDEPVHWREVEGSVEAGVSDAQCVLEVLTYETDATLWGVYISRVS